MKGIIYCIKELSNGEIIYIGSTTKKFIYRKCTHLYACFTLNKDYPVYKHIREITGRDDFYEHFSFDELCSEEFDDKTQLRGKEREFIELHKPAYNKNKAFISDYTDYFREWRKSHPNYNKEYLREWRKNHPEYVEYTRKCRAKMKSSKNQ